nr:uncharacterized protein LOC127342191 isoform X3 [Lolium perenne]
MLRSASTLGDNILLIIALRFHSTIARCRACGGGQQREQGTTSSRILERVKGVELALSGMVGHRREAKKLRRTCQEVGTMMPWRRDGLWWQRMLAGHKIAADEDGVAFKPWELNPVTSSGWLEGMEGGVVDQGGEIWR